MKVFGVKKSVNDREEVLPFGNKTNAFAAGRVSSETFLTMGTGFSHFGNGRL